MIDFTLDLIPPNKTAQQKGERIITPKDGSGQYILHYQKASLADIERAYCTLLVTHRPPQPLAGFVRCHLTFTWPWLAKHTKKHRAFGWYPHGGKPDWDNAAKLFCDCLKTVGFFQRDDAQIFDGRLIKGHGDRPGIRVRLSEWHPGQTLSS
ncbi:RusA family crossover junction endodeoxyribonuclease [Geminisphaera colitermitum]|uniref:RusA family crossover junction endodeoxyribonuclease n=1 Tax=Geminisphaera colitermitum TaxID=1148786 RepID=UPI00019652D4|nr:RusA family crossover junction endodeoxyribonuclease [Geminisphaera colitermitum]